MNIIYEDNEIEITELDFNEVKDIYGAGKGGGGGGGEQDDSLSSKQTIRALLAVSEGPIDSIDTVYLNNTPSSSFKRVSYDSRDGTGDQTVMDGFSKVETPHPDSAMIELPYNTRVTKTVTDAAVDSLRITLGVNSLYKMDDKGNIGGTLVEFNVYRRKNSSDPWPGTPNKVVAKAGKTRNPYAWSLRVKRPLAADGITDLWQVSIIRATEDDNPTNKTSSKTSWISTIEIYNEVKTYPNTALIGIEIGNAIRFGGGVPTIMARIKGLKLKVPTSDIYNAETGAYVSTNWDGTFDPVLRWTPNPSWMIYNILTNTTWGLGIDEAEIDKFSFFDLAVYCDEQVTDGKGGTERRYELHNQFMTREDAPTFLMYLLNICNANLIIDNFGNHAITYDHEQDPELIIGNNEVIDGIFEYSSTNFEERLTQVNVTWNNPNLLGGTDTVTWPTSPGSTEQEMIDRYGLQSTDIILAGCYSERQALWKARWVWYTTCKLTNIVSFKTLFYGMVFKIGQVIEIIDNENINVARVFKITSYNFIDSTKLELFLDGDVNLTNDVFTVAYFSASGPVEYPILESNGTFSKITIDEASAVATPYYNTDAYITGDIQPTTWKVVSVSVDSETQVHTITAMEYNVNKFTYVESGTTVEDPLYYGFPSSSVPAVESISVVRDVYDDGINAGIILNIKWLWFQNDTVKTTYTTEHAAWVAGGEIGPEPIPKNSEAVAYNVSYRRNNGNYVELPTSYAMSATIEDAVFGVYEITVVALNSSGIESIDTTFTYNYVSGSPSTLLPPINLYVEGTTDTAFTDETLRATFEYDSDNDTKEDKLSIYIIEVYDTSGTNLKNTYTVKPDAAKNGLFVYTIQQNASDFGTPTREFMLKVYSMDTIGGISTAISATFANPAPAAISISVEMGADTATVTLPDITGDIQGYDVHMSTTDGFSPSGANKQYEGSASKTTIYLTASGTYYFKAAAYDKYGRDTLNYSTQVSATCVGLPAPRIQPSTLEKIDTYSITSDITVSTGTETAILSYDYTSLQTSGTAVALCINASFGCPVDTTRVKIEIYNTSNTLLDSYYIYNRDGQSVQQRFFYGGKTFGVTVPSDETFRIKVVVKQASGSDKTFTDPFIDIVERYK
jgi:predicted phage tail protein